jgi:predicted nucleic acid-binding protein
MILVDTSVWVDYFNGQINPHTNALDDALEQGTVAIGDLIFLEILQGFRNDRDYELARQQLSKLPIFDMLGATAVRRCADIYRQLRKRGITIRKTADVIIASFCIEHQMPLLTKSEDFEPYLEFLKLRPADLS